MWLMFIPADTLIYKGTHQANLGDYRQKDVSFQRQANILPAALIFSTRPTTDHGVTMPTSLDVVDYRLKMAATKQEVDVTFEL